MRCGRFLISTAFIGAVLALALPVSADAQNAWPSKTITYVVPYPPGGQQTSSDGFLPSG